MVELGGGLGFAVEALQLLVRGKLAGENHLQGHDPVQLDLQRFINDAHAPASDLAQDFIIAEAGDRRRSG
jgi:hypothetical protein